MVDIRLTYMLHGAVKFTKMHETPFPPQVLCPGGSSNTANATRRKVYQNAKFTRITHSPFKVPLTTDTGFRHHSLGIVSTQGTLRSRLAFFIDLPLSHDTRFPLWQGQGGERKTESCSSTWALNHAFWQWNKRQQKHAFTTGRVESLRV